MTLHFGNDAVYTVALGEERCFRLGCVTEPDQALRAALRDQAGEAKVVDFTGDPRFEAVGTLTLRSESSTSICGRTGCSRCWTAYGTAAPTHFRPRSWAAMY